MHQVGIAAEEVSPKLPSSSWPHQESKPGGFGEIAKIGGFAGMGPVIVWSIVRHRFQNSKGGTDVPVEKLMDIQPKGPEELAMLAQCWQRAAVDDDWEDTPEHRVHWLQKHRISTGKNLVSKEKVQVWEPLTVGQWVWVRVDKRANKLAPRWEGPYKVIWTGDRHAETVVFVD